MNAINLTTGKNVVVTDFDGGEGILVDLNTKRYYKLNETAMLVWRAMVSISVAAGLTPKNSNTFAISVSVSWL